MTMRLVHSQTNEERFQLARAQLLRTIDDLTGPFWEDYIIHFGLVILGLSIVAQIIGAFMGSSFPWFALVGLPAVLISLLVDWIVWR